MKKQKAGRPLRCGAMIFIALLSGTPLAISAEDIDIFVGNSSNSGRQGVPNVLIILDNTSNWSRDEGFSSGQTQGQIEVAAIKSVLANLTDMNVGLMLANDSSGSNDSGAFVHYALKFMESTATTGSNKYNLNQRLDAIAANIGDTKWKGPSSLSYGGMMFNAFKYFGGFTSPAHATDDIAGTPTDDTHFGPIAYQGGSTPSGQAPGLPGVAMLDTDAYTIPSPITTSTNSYPNLTYRSPLSSVGETCGAENYIIFISNKSPNVDTNSVSLLSGVGGATTRLARPNVVATTQNGVNVYVPDANGGTSAPPSGDSWYMPEWARFLRKTDVSSLAGQQNVVTYAINVYHKSDNANQQFEFTRMLMAAATAGGGKYFTVTQEAQLDSALKTIFAEIQATSTTFASAALPVSSTNRAVNLNEVYIGMFRPDKTAKPRWFGNLKRYQLVRSSAGIRLGDALGANAVNNTSGFLLECAASYWSTDSGTYWSNVAIDPVPLGTCPNNLWDPTTQSVIAHDPYSDYPDGPFVEKGGVAEVLRKRNTTTSPRTILTSAAGTSLALTAFTASGAGLSTGDYNFIIGQDVNDENQNQNITEMRPSIHSDVVHSRPLAVDYGASTGGTAIYYGANDGMLRAVDADTGAEKWAYVAPEFYSRLPRLRAQSPLINYPSVTDPAAKPKDYFFDGSIGLYQKADNSKVWMYPTMRRGGRMVYAFDISPPTAGSTTTPPAQPTIKWKFGCPNSTNDSGCIGDALEIGQTWSMPVVARVNVDGNVKPVVIFGGGYDTCEDANVANPACSSSGLVTGSTAKGNRIYVLDADDGSVIKKFTLSNGGRIPSDIAVIDVDYDGYVDYAYVGDTQGNLYRVAFGPSKTAPLATTAWTAVKIAGTANAGRKFLYPPALVSYFQGGKTYVYTALGSGDREKPLESQYPYQSDVKNRFYVFVDDLSVAAPTPTDLDDTSVMQDFNTDPFTTGFDCGQGIVPGTSGPYAGKKGWFMQYSTGTGNGGNQGEQTVTSATIVGGLVAFSTNRPIHATDTACTPKGEAKGYFVNLFNSSGSIGPGNLFCGGARYDTFVGGGLPPSPVVGTVNIGGVPATVIIGAADRSGGASTPIGGQEGFSLSPQRRTRVFWKQDIDN